MLPARLEDWTIKHIEQLAARGVYESDSFDLKEMLPHSLDDGGKFRLRKTCAAFANSAGGFIVFGVSNDSQKSAADRIVGVETSLDFPARFGELPAHCEPSVEWHFRNPALTINASRVAHVVQIPRSWKAPH